MPFGQRPSCARRPRVARSLLTLLALALAGVGSAHAGPDADAAREVLAGHPPPSAIGDAVLPIDPAVAQAVRTAPGRLPQLAIAVDDVKLPLPLEHTRVFAEVTGFVARVDVVQTYANPFETPIEAIYTFPLPENAAVDDMKIRVGERIIAAEIRERAEAKAEYQQAKAAGHTAALLEQERPNIFTQSVANIAPGESIEVSIRYVQHLTYDAGTYEFVFPMVVGPRFIPGAPTGQQGPGWSADTTDVPDASRITPPIIGAGQRTGHDIELEVVVHAGVPMLDVQTPTHDTEVFTDSEGTLNVQLAAGDRLPNRDFVMRYRVDGAMPQAAGFSSIGPDGGVVSLMVQPPRIDVEGLVGQREIIFVVDVSGSMFGAPLGQAKAAMREAIAGLGPDDTFNVMTFAGRTAQVFAQPRPANHENMGRALEFIASARAGGGTYLANAVDAALRPEVPDGRHRYVVFLTDGFIGNEQQIFAASEALVQAQKARGRRARVFGFGVGSNVNRHLLEGMARAGDGVSQVLTLGEDPRSHVDRLYRTIDHPIMTDVRIDWGDLEVTAVEPAVTPDLLASRPLVVMGRYANAGKGIITVHGKVNGKDIALPVPVELSPVAASGDDFGVLSSLWARARVQTLSRRLWQGHDAKAVERITQLGLSYRLVTAYTSFIAVDRSRVVGASTKTIVQPTERPHGVNVDMAAPAAAQAGMLHALGGRADGLNSVFGDSRAASGFGGLGLRGTGSGGGGFANAAVGKGSGYGRGMAVGGKKAKARPKVIPGRPVVTGALDHEIIRRVIRRHRNAVRYCYEKALNKDPKLSGKLYISFKIGPEGKVLGALVTDDSTLEDKAVRGCVVNRVKRMRFPAPKGGSVVQVTYPFIFKP